MSRLPAIILLVEDNPADVYFVRAALRQEGINSEVLVARDGEKAIEILDDADADLRVQCPELILLDLNLPRTSGTEVLRRVRQSPRCQGVPVIIVTSSDAPNDHAETASLGASRYFLKPHDLDEYLKLGSIVRQVCETER